MGDAFEAEKAGRPDAGRGNKQIKYVLAFFGAFNPPTRAHLGLADFAFRASGREGVLFVPSRSDYIRDEQRKDGVFSSEERLAMLRKLAETRPWMAVTDWELRRPEQPRSYVTLCALREEGFSPSLLMGSDKLREFTSWRFVPEIAREFGIVCLARGKDSCRRIIEEDPLLKELEEHITVLDTPDDWKDFSSSAVREALRRGLDGEVRRMVPEEILDRLCKRSGRNRP